MRLGFRTKIFLVVCGTAALGLAVAHASFVAWAVTGIAALAGAWLLSAGFANRLQAVEAAGAQTI